MPLAGRPLGASAVRPHAHRATSMTCLVSSDVIVISVMSRTRLVATSMRPLPHAHSTSGTSLRPTLLRPNLCLTTLSGLRLRDTPGCPVFPPRLPAGAPSPCILFCLFSSFHSSELADGGVLGFV